MPPHAPTTSIPPSDAALLGRFARTREEEAFAEIVRRHGGMVLSVCRSVLGAGPDAEDAMQAVFVTLAKKASARGVQVRLAGWLHRVAWYVSLRQAKAAGIRRRHEQEAARMRAQCTRTDEPDIPLDQLHAGLERLPETYRAPLLLHHLEGRTQEETAAILGVGVSAVAMRLTRGRQMLRDRLAKRGMVASAAGLAAVLASSGSAGASAALVAVTAKAATAAATGPWRPARGCLQL